MACRQFRESIAFLPHGDSRFATDVLVEEVKREDERLEMCVLKAIQASVEEEQSDPLPVPLP